MSVTKPVAKLNGVNIIDYLFTLQEMKSQVSKHFNFDSPLWKAIYSHIHKESENPAFFDIPQNYRISLVQGIGFQSVLAYAFNSKTILIQFEVGFLEEDSNDNLVRSYHIECPVDLELDFTEEKFDGWLKEVRAKKDLKRTEEELEVLETLVKKYPKETKKLIKKPTVKT